MPRHRRGWAMARDGMDEGKRHTPLTISMLEPALLSLLKSKSGHGYTLLSELERMGMNTIHPSVVYRTLREMEDLDWIQSTWNADQTQGPPRRTYSLTPTGEDALQKWREELSKTQGLISHLLENIS